MSQDPHRRIDAQSDEHQEEEQAPELSEGQG